jgi:hypothetical protein
MMTHISAGVCLGDARVVPVDSDYMSLTTFMQQGGLIKVQWGPSTADLASCAASGQGVTFTAVIMTVSLYHMSHTLLNETLSPRIFKDWNPHHPSVSSLPPPPTG